jgi:zinc protease
LPLVTSFQRTAAAILLAAAGVPIRAAEPCAVLPFPVTQKTLANGLRVVVVPTPFPRTVTLAVAVEAGVREAVAPGTSAMPRIIERLMIGRGTSATPRNRYERTIALLAARQTSTTTDDATTYETTFVRDDLHTILELEADRFQNLAFSSEDVRAIASQIIRNEPRTTGPLALLFQTQRARAFRVHGYRNVASGSRQDLEALQRDAGETRKFFERFYRPERTTLVIAGDVDPERAMAEVEALWSGWKPGEQATAVPQEPPATAPLFANAKAPAETPPWLTIGFHGPAFSAASRDYAAFQLLMQLSFGNDSELRRQMLEERTVDYFGVDLPQQIDPSMATIYARVIESEDVVRVRDRILTEVALRRTRAIEPSRLALAQTGNRAGSGATLDETEAIARVVANFARLGRDAGALDRYACTVASLTSADLLAAANRYLTNENMVVTTVASEGLSPSLPHLPTVEALLARLPKPAAVAEVTGDPSIIVQKSALHDLDIKIAFRAGSGHDPVGKDGLASLAASMVAGGGSAQQKASEIEDELRAIGATWSAHVDRELTVFTGRVDAAQWSRFLDVVLPSLLTPAFDRYDLQRMKQQKLVALDDLRNNPEELAKEVLQARAFQNGPYGHPAVGTTAGIRSATVADVRDFIGSHYRAGNLIMAVSGDVPDALVARLRSEMKKLPAGGTAPLQVRPRPPLDVLVDAYRSPNTQTAAISFGFPIDVTRTHPDFAALSVARSWLGEHRSPLSHLAQRIRDARGLNLGDYAYIEAFPNAAGRFVPPQNVVRRKQLFEVWLRPVAPENAAATLRIAVYELRNLIRDGLTEEQFRTTRDYLLKNVETWTPGQDEQLSAAIDGHWHGLPDFAAYMRDQLRKLTRAEVNLAIQEHLSGENFYVAVVTPDVANLKKELTGSRVPNPKYDSPRPKAITDEDEQIAAEVTFRIEPADVRALPVSEAFAR